MRDRSGGVNRTQRSGRRTALPTTLRSASRS
jgi:hypothetical protein